MRGAFLLLAVLAAARPAAAQQPDTAVQWLSALDLALVEQGWERARADSSVDGRPLRIGGRTYARGVGSHSDGIARIRLDRAFRFVADVGVDDEAVSSEGVSRGTVRFQFVVDRKQVHETAVLRGGDAPVRVEIDLRGASELWLLIDATDDGNAYDHADWADARIVYTAGAEAPRLYRPPPKPAVALTPAPPAAPRITGPSIVGGSVGKPFLYRIPATGRRPLRYFIEGLPPGLLADPATGIITGRAERAGRYPVTVGAENDAGVVERTLTLAFGEGLALTPPMGWNSWNIWGCAIDDAKIRAAADRLVESGLADHGWNHVNIDDCWMRKPGPDARDPVTGAILTNERFPDMKGLADYVHARGLRLGIYIGPNERTCQGYEASIGHERADLEQFARWGIDYVKYDWCSSKRDSLVEKYTMYGELLKTLDRDITYSICQYGWQNVWEWGARAGGNLWRTTGDIVDTWGSMAGIGFNQDRMAPFAGPGHWNDPDMLVVGMVGWGPKPRPTRLTPDEQYTHISLWSLLAAPLLIGADLDQLDAFTLNLLTNDEVLAIDQDPLGRQATRIPGSEGDVWARPLADGSWAVGLFNRDFDEHRVRIDWSTLGIAGPQQVRDAWRQLDLGTHADGYEAIVPSHGVVLLRVRAAAPPSPSGAKAKAANRKVLLIGIDGVRGDILAKARTPNLDALAAAGVFTDSAETRMPTVSGPSWSSMLTGAWHEAHGVTGNSFEARRYDAYPDFLTRLERIDPAFHTFAIADWTPLARLEDGLPLLSDAIDTRIVVDGDSLGYPAADERVTDTAAAHLRRADIDAAFVYLGNVDEIGHEHGTLSAEYLHSIEVADAQVGRLVAALRARPDYRAEDWLVLVSTDHGRRDDGGHGGPSAWERRIIFLASGGAVDRSAALEGVRIVDVAATALGHLGVAMEAGWRLDGSDVFSNRRYGR